MNLNGSIDANSGDDETATSPFLVDDNCSILDNFLLLKSSRPLEGDEDTRSELKFDDGKLLIFKHYVNFYLIIT